MDNTVQYSKKKKKRKTIKRQKSQNPFTWVWSSFFFSFLLNLRRKYFSVPKKKTSGPINFSSNKKKKDVTVDDVSQQDLMSVFDRMDFTEDGKKMR